MADIRDFNEQGKQLCEWIEIDGKRFQVPVYKLVTGPVGQYGATVSTDDPLPTNDSGGGGGGGGLEPGDPVDLEAERMFFDSALDEAPTAIKATPGQLHGIHVINTNNVDIFLQFFNLAAGSVILGTTVPRQVYVVPANGAYDFESTRGRDFTAAITVAASTTPTGAVGPTADLTFSAVYR